MKKIEKRKNSKLTEKHHSKHKSKPPEPKTEEIMPQSHLSSWMADAAKVSKS